MGFDIKSLLIGSEGTLGIITKVKLRLFPEIKEKVMAIVAADSIENTINFLNFTKNQCYEYLSAFEVNSKVGLNLIKKYYKKPSNLKRLEDDLLEKIILEYIEQFAKVKEIEIQTKDLRKQEQTNG